MGWLIRVWILFANQSEEELWFLALALRAKSLKRSPKKKIQIKKKSWEGLGKKRGAVKVVGSTKGRRGKRLETGERRLRHVLTGAIEYNQSLFCFVFGYV